MTRRRKLLLGLMPALALLLAAEATLRVKYFLFHHGDWRYLFAPLTPVTGFDIFSYAKADPNKTTFRWQAPCVDTKVFSSERQQELPRTWSADCLRGPDRVSRQKPSQEFRILILGGSTVEDAQSDEEMWATVFKRRFPPTYQDKAVTVVNGGRAGFDSKRVSILLGPDGSRFLA